MWSKLDHGFFRNPKTLTVGQDARLLYLAGVCYAGDRLTDGVIPDDALPIVAAEAQVSDIVTAVARLVAAGLWHAVTGGHRIHDFFDFNPNATQTKARRDATRSRTAAYRARKKTAVLTRSNGDLGDAVTHASHARSSQRTNLVKDSDSDSELRVPAPQPPTPPAPAERAQEPIPLRAIPKPRELERAAIEAHPLTAPLSQVFGPPVTRDLDGWRDDLAALDELGARPEDIPRAAIGYAATMGVDGTGRPIAMTRKALIAHWFRSLHAPLTAARAQSGERGGRMPVHGQLDPAKYLTGQYAHIFNRKHEDDDAFDSIGETSP